MANTHAALPDEARFIANPNTVLREEDETAILFNPDTGAVHVLNFTAVAIWKLLDGKRNVRQIVADLRAEFDEMDAAAEAQVVELLEQLYALGAVVSVTEFPL